MATIRPLPAEEEAVRRYTEELWLRYHRDLEATVENHALVEDVPLRAEIEFRLDKLESDEYWAWVAVDGPETADSEPTRAGSEAAEPTRAGSEAAEPTRAGSEASTPSLAGTDGTFVGFITAERERAPPVFDRPDRLRIGDIHVCESHRGTGLARDLFEQALDRARATECAELTLDVDVDNERALGFYEKMGFAPHRYEMTRPVENG